MIRTMVETDRTAGREMAGGFYLLRGRRCTRCRRPYHKWAFAERMRSDAYVRGDLFEQQGRPAGYALTFRSCSAEAGGMVLWIEELSCCRNFWAGALAACFFAYLETHHALDGIARLRLKIASHSDRARALYAPKGASSCPASGGAGAGKRSAQKASARAQAPDRYFMNVYPQSDPQSDRNRSKLTDQALAEKTGNATKPASTRI